MGAERMIAVCGGIGSGKSVVCRILRCMGYPVYDCDTEAKRLMDSSDEIRHTIAREIAADAIDDAGRIDRACLAAAVFGNPHKLGILNSVVHGCVIDDLQHWRETLSGIVFVETAILYQSGLDKLVDEVWEVTAPEGVRIERVMARNGLSEAEVRRRIESQRFEPEQLHRCTRVIVNDDVEALLPQILGLLPG